MADIPCAVKAPAKKYRLDWACFQRFKLCCSILFNSYLCNASLLFIFLLGLCLGQQLVIFNVGLLPSEFMDVLGEKDSERFKPLLIKSFALILLIAFCNSAVKFVSGYLYLTWRESLTSMLHRKYFFKSIFYSVNVIDNDIDNVDQRMTQDVDRFCLQLSEISPKIVISPLTIIYYSYQCFKSTGYVGPLVIYGYFIIGTIANRLIISSIITLIYKQERYEGDFRFKHTQIRSSSESIAMMKAEKNELQKVNTFFAKLFKIQRKIVHSEVALNFSTNLIDYIGSILSYIVIGIPIFAGGYEDLSPVGLSSLISKNAFVSMYLIQCFSTLIDLSTKITDLCGYTHRIGELIEKFTDYKKSMKDQFLSELKCETPKNVIFEITDITYSAPKSTKVLVSSLNLIIERNVNVLITGNTGTGKSSLLRILANLWQPDSGIIRRSNFIKRIMFLPQKPVLTNGSLIDQIIYPTLKSSILNYKFLVEKVEKALDNIGLQCLISRIGGIDVEPDWSWPDGLSPGEIQRISFARVFYHEPTLVLLDEATSALGVSEEDCFYTYCNQLDITIISVGHRDSLKQYHDMCLNIKKDGSWTYSAI